MTSRATVTKPERNTRPFPPPTGISEELIEKNLGLARQAAWKFHRKTGQPYDDLESIAFVGLIRGCRRYDPTRINPGTGRPYALSTVVVPFITGEILHWFRDKGHAIKYPSKWREQWGKVQRLMADPLVSADQVAEQAGMKPEELQEMLSAMTGVSNLDDHHGADACEAPIAEVDHLSPLRMILLQAWFNLHPGDQKQILAWWAQPRKLVFPTGPMQQFHGRIKLLLQGRRLSEVLQVAMEITVPPPQPQPAPEDYGLTAVPMPRRSRKALEARAAQLGLLAS